MSIRKFLGLEPRKDDRSEQPSGSSETATVRKIVDALDRLPEAEARRIAAFAYVLSRVARADLEISSAETRAMERIVHELGGLTEEQAILVVQMAKTQSLLFAGTENFLVTREYNRLVSHDEKLGLLECLFAVSAADQSISAVEDHEIRRIASELQLEHGDFIAARAAFRQYLAVLKAPPAES
jgi:uncharacterized tellurite resistance protein B-like protein